MPDTKFTRRQFLRIVGISGAGAAALKLGADLTSRSATVSETRYLMGTVVNLTLVTDEAGPAQVALAACLDHMTGLEAIFSRHQLGSQISRLNQSGMLDSPDRHLVDVLREARRISSLTDGAFDITVKPVLDLYADAASRGELPTDADIEAKQTGVGYAGLHVMPEQIRFTAPGMAVTLDSIAKGYIVDEGIAVLTARGFEQVLVEAGGDLAATGQRREAQPWQVGIRSPRVDGPAVLATLDVNARAVATSGDYMQPFTTDFSAHHIIDPRTGYSAPQLSSATVIAPSCMLADALATSMMVLGPEAGLSTLQAFPDCEAILVDKHQVIYASDALAWISPTVF